MNFSLRCAAFISFVLLLVAPGGELWASRNLASASQPTAAGTISVASASFQQGASWPAASPITITVSFNQDVLLANWQWVGVDGKPVVWNGETLASNDLRPTQGAWTGAAAAPPQPGAYRVQINVRASGSTTTQNILLDLRGTALADTDRPTKGFVYVRAGNLWVRSLDFKTERALTFYGRPGNAAMPAWSPDGSVIAFVRDLGTADSNYDLWLINPDGTSPRMISQHSGDKALGYPVFAPDGTLYVAESRPLSFQGVDLDETWDLDRVDMASGKRTPVLSGALMPDISPDGKQIVYIQQTITSDGTIENSLTVSTIDGSNDHVLVAASPTSGLYAPGWSPDGKNIVYAAMVAPPTAKGKAPGLAAPLAHGGVWDIWTISASGGDPQMLSPVQEDLPYPRWMPDNSEIAFISPTGLWTVPVSGGAAVLEGPSYEHSELSIYEPQMLAAPPLSGAAQLFPETGKTLRGIFLNYWNTHGGLTQFGYPITNEVLEGGRTVQYMQRARLEWHPEYKGSASEVLLGLLGTNTADTRAAAGEKPFQRATAISGARFFPETGHNLQGQIRAYWEAQGGLPVFGYPLSEAFMEKSATDGKTYLVQYFERNRLEYHPEFAGTPSEILLGLLGVQELDRRYGAP